MDNTCHSEIYHFQKQFTKEVYKCKRFANKETFHRQYKDYKNMLQKKQMKLLQTIFQSQYEQC